MLIRSPDERVVEIVRELSPLQRATLAAYCVARTHMRRIALGSMGDPILARAATSVLSKVAATLPNDREQYLLHAISQVFRPTPRYAPSLHLETVRGACWREEALHVCYADKDGAISERVILTLGVVYTERTQTVLAWCCLRKDFRMFRTDRLQSVRRTGTSFRPRRVSLLRDYLAELEQRALQTANDG